MDAQRAFEQLMAGNGRFVRGERQAYDLVRRREELLAGQHPLATIVCCSDSRVVPELVFDARLGDIFTVESAGNVVDDVGLGSLEYGVEHLGTPLLMILGHTRCGAVTASCQGGPHGAGRISAVLGRIEAASEHAHRNIDAAIDRNVRDVAAFVLGESAIVAQLVERGTLRVVTARYVMETGKVELLA